MEKTDFIEQVKSLAASYQPNSNVKERLSRLRLIAVVGPTGVGKSTIIDKSGIPLVLSDMTRPPRVGEKDGVDVNFRSDYETLLNEVKNGEFVQFLVGHTSEFYGTKIDSYPTGGVCAAAIVSTALDVFSNLGFESMEIIYILPPSFDEWMQRTLMHDDPDFMKRLVEAQESLEYAISQANVKFIVNERIEDAVNEFKNIAYEKNEYGENNNGGAVAQGLLVRLKEKLSS